MSADRLISTAMIVALGLLFLGWLVVQAVGEVRLAREYRRPSDWPLKRESCLRRIDPVTGQRWVSPVLANEPSEVAR